MATDKPSYPSDAAEKFIVRLPPGMRDKIAESAKVNGRSMNGEVVTRLENSFEQGDSVLLTRAIARLETLLASTETAQELIEVELGFFGAWVYAVFGEGGRPEAEKEKLLAVSKAYADAAAGKIDLAKASIERLREAASRLDEKQRKVLALRLQEARTKRQQQLRSTGISGEEDAASPA